METQPFEYQYLLDGGVHHLERRTMLIQHSRHVNINVSPCYFRLYSLCPYFPVMVLARMHYVHLMHSDSKGEELVTLKSRSQESIHEATSGEWRPASCWQHSQQYRYNSVAGVQHAVQLY